MRVKPILRYREPSYPRRPTVDDHPELMGQVPERWKGKPAVLAALSSLLTLASTAKALDQTHKSLVAPLFIHGEGVGSFGCRVTNPPVFLTETEARQVVRDEAKKAGLYFRGDRSKIGAMKVKVFDRRRREVKEQPLTVDAKDRGKDVSYVFVSSSDCYDGQGYILLNLTTKDVAQGLATKIAAEKPAGTYGVFYEPFTYPDRDAKDSDKAWQEAQETNRQELRKQVRDFVQWLKSQGVI